MFCVSMSLPMRKSQRAGAKKAAARLTNQSQKRTARPSEESRGWRPILLSDLCDNPCADGPAAFADREAQALVHRDRRDELDAQAHIVARHDHFGPGRELDLA